MFRKIFAPCVVLFLWLSCGQGAFAQVFVPKKGAPFPRDLIVELIFPDEFSGDVGKRKAAELTRLVKENFRLENKNDRGPYHAKCMFNLFEWDLEGELDATFKLVCYSGAMWEGDSLLQWIGSADEPEKLMEVVNDLAKRHTDRQARKRPEPVLRKRQPPEEYLRHDWSVIG